LGQFIASFVMILGYGIIAVPTGIVTAKSQRTHDKVSIKNHVRNAVPKIIPTMLAFAPHCGHSLTPLIYEAIPAMHYNSSQ
jgi:voltage-gated potassium channel